MKVDCPHCDSEITINEPTGPTELGAILVKCSECGKMLEVENPHGDDMFVTSEDLFPPGERFIAAGSRISFEQARSLGLMEEVEDDE